MSALASLLLEKQAKQLSTHPVEYFSAGLANHQNFREWDVMIFGPPDTIYEYGIFKAVISFPEDYPLRPPTVKFTTEMWHPDGTVCISILQPPGDDPYGYELASERWSPVHTVEMTVLSIISLLSEPNAEASANVDAAKEWRERRDLFNEKVRLSVRKSQEEF